MPSLDFRTVHSKPRIAAKATISIHPKDRRPSGAESCVALNFIFGCSMPTPAQLCKQEVGRTSASSVEPARPLRLEIRSEAIMSASLTEPLQRTDRRADGRGSTTIQDAWFSSFESNQPTWHAMRPRLRHALRPNKVER